jgi:flavin reductase (DIM6/NTAB) family NADH-FMN oxidoreductase RutF
MAQSFRPGPETARAFRTALGQFATGVTIVTCLDAAGPVAMTANSFASVSLDPPLVLWSPAIASSRHDAFVFARHFSIHVLHEGQMGLARDMARDGRSFAPGLWAEGPAGVPVLRDSLARFDCAHHAAHAAGDHTIVVGLVEAVLLAGGVPLVFAQGAYGRFAEGF